MKALLFGHSFVKSISDHFSTIDCAIDSRKLCYKFKVEAILRKFYLHGIRGAKVTDNFDHKSLIESFQPQIVIIDLGSNDIVGGTSVNHIADSLIDLAVKISEVPCVIVVAICGILFRKELTGRYRELRDLNSLIKSKTSNFPKIVFHEHKLLKKEPLAKISKDGVHPNTTLGRSLYVKSIHWALHSICKEYKLGRVFYNSEVRVLS